MLILGANGMLGTAVTRAFNHSNFEIFVTTRQGQLDKELNHLHFDAERQNFEELIEKLPPIDLVINCIGVIKQKNRDDDATCSQKMVRVNSEFPAEIVSASTKFKFKFLTIGTDCVFSGREGSYSEASQHSPIDIYGQSKTDGEIDHHNVMTLRTSIIGPDDATNSSLHNWLTSQPHSAEVPGFVNHLWNGITTYAFSKVAVAIAGMNHFYSGTFHLIPQDSVSKFELLNLIAIKRNRLDLRIFPEKSPEPIDRRLMTVHPTINIELWNRAGYMYPPKISDLIREMY